MSSLENERGMAINTGGDIPNTGQSDSSLAKTTEQQPQGPAPVMCRGLQRTENVTIALGHRTVEYLCKMRFSSPVVPRLLDEKLVKMLLGDCQVRTLKKNLNLKILC